MRADQAKQNIQDHSKASVPAFAIDNPVVYWYSEFVFLKGQRTIYHVDLVLRETEEVVDDGLSLVFVNTAVDDNSPIADYMRCMLQTEVNSEKFPVFTRRLHEVKDTEGGRTAMCKVIEEYGEQQRREGLREGRQEERQSSIRVLARTLMELKNISEADAMKEAESRILQAQGPFELQN